MQGITEMLNRVLEALFMGSTDTRPAGEAHIAGPPWLNRIDWLLLFLVLAVAVFSGFGSRVRSRRG